MIMYGPRSTSITGLFTDLYELRMAASYLRRGMVGPATFSLFVRDLPPERGFLVAAGLADALAWLEELRFTADDEAYLRDGLRLPAGAVTALGRLRFTGDVWAVPEGRIVFAGEPLLEVTAPIAEAQLVETALLNDLTYQTAIASKAARCRLAAGRAQLIDFSARRTHGRQAALAAARASAIAGFTATSNVEAAARYGLQAAGTMAHSFVEAFDTEADAFTAFATDYPAGAVLLVDTYDSLNGIRTAIDVARRLRLPSPIGIRLDSGDLCSGAKNARRLLDAAGLSGGRIVAGGGLDEYVISDLVAAGAPIDAYGVETKLGVSADAPALDSAYKLVSYGARPVMKLSPGKATLPGPKWNAYSTTDTNRDQCRPARAPSARQENAPARFLQKLMQRVDHRQATTYGWTNMRPSHPEGTPARAELQHSSQAALGSVVLAELELGSEYGSSTGNSGCSGRSPTLKSRRIFHSPAGDLCGLNCGPSS
jgi:nicotinate phosphoribosyltransferase